MDWDPNFLARSPIFEPLNTHLTGSWPARWPGLPLLQGLLDRRVPPVCVASGMPLRLVPQAVKRGRAELRYEERTYQRAELQVRPNNWHDLFNVLVWLTFPQAKAALNARHHAAASGREPRATSNRGPAEDALTLFDEGGVIVTATSRELLELLREHEWKELFWRRRGAVVEEMRFYLFGHALYEKALRPFTGITGRGLCFDVGGDFMQAPAPVRLAELDERVAARIRAPERFAATRDLAHVPILGVPGWCADNETASYYDNIDYFRPRPRRANHHTPRG